MPPNDVLNTLKSVWSMTLYSAAGSEVRLNQIVIALAIIIIGIIVSKRLARLLGTRLQHVQRLQADHAYIIQKLTAYALYVITVLFALPFAGIPITFFAVLGGAAAIGVGFGAQNLINNLISGLILLVERPIRIGDIVELEHERGRVDEIGNRCVRVRRFDGVYVLVPNSYFLEQRVTNWTLVNKDVRGEVSVGVAYGSPTAEVRRLMLQAAGEQSAIEKQPVPEVLFEDFGDNALTFTLFFWTMVSAPMDLRRLQSDLRYRIDELFRSAAIVIAFPQRDVHLDTATPLRIELQSGDRGAR